MIHSVDRISLLDALAKEAEKAGRHPRVYVQVNIGEEEQKGGCAISEVGTLGRRGPRLTASSCRTDGDPAAGRRAGALFRAARQAGARAGVSGLSMGMSADFKAAVMLGATAVRVGTALFED